MATIVTTEAKNLSPGDVFNFRNQKTRFVLVKINKLYFEYKNTKTGKEYQSSFYNALVEIRH